MTTTAFTQTSPDAVRCSDCRFSPGRHKATCQTAHRIIHGLGYWRKCDQYAYGPQPFQPRPKAKKTSTRYKPPRAKPKATRPKPKRQPSRAPEIRYVAKEHLKAALANHPGAMVIQFRPRSEA